jgi:predicted ester cyclase
MRTHQATLIEQFIIALRRDPAASPPPGLDAATARAVRAVMAAQQTAPPRAEVRRRVWEKAVKAAGRHAEPAGPTPSANGQRAQPPGEVFARLQSQPGMVVGVRPSSKRRSVLSYVAVLLGVVIFNGLLIAALNAGKIRDTFANLSYGPRAVFTSRTQFEHFIDSAWNMGNTGTLDSLLTAAHVFQVPGLAEIEGVPGMAQVIEDFRAAFPGAQFTIVSMDSTKDRVRARLAVSVPSGDSLTLPNGVILAPTGQPITFEMRIDAQFDDDRIAAIEAQPDGVGLWLMVDALPSLAAGEDLDHLSQRIDTVLQVDRLLDQGSVNADDLAAVASLALVVHDTTPDGVPVERDYTDVLAGRLAPDPLPERYVSAERIFARGDLVAVQIVAQGTADEALWREWIELYRFEEGKIVEMWRFWNRGFYAAPTG